MAEIIPSFNESSFGSQVVFEDTHLIVIEKAAGVLSQEDGSDSACVVAWLRQYFGRPYVGVVHRLDRNTSGLMVYAKRTKSAGRLAEFLKTGLLIRRYQALLWGVPETRAFEWRDYLVKDERTNTSKVVSKHSKYLDAKLAVLKGSILEQKAKASLCTFELETGRSHQIRVQAAHRDLALLGDEKYDLQFRMRTPKFSRPALHSCYLSFPHPMNKENVLTFNSSLPEDLSSWWGQL